MPIENRMARAVLALTLLAGALAFPAAAAAQGWTAPVALNTCGAVSQPKVVFPSDGPSTRSGAGAILWLGLSPSCTDVGTGQTTIDAAPLAGNDTPGTPASFSTGGAAQQGLVGPLVTASTARGKIVAIAGSNSRTALGSPEALLGQGFAASGFDKFERLGAPADLLASANGFRGDADIAYVFKTASGRHQIVLRAETHGAHVFGPALILPAGSAPITALTLGMDYRADRLVVWAESGEVWAQWVLRDGTIYPKQKLGPSGSEPQLSAVLSDDNHAFVIWTDEPPAGAGGLTTVYLDHSADNVVFHAPKVLASFAEPADLRLTPHAVAVVRLSGEGVALVWPTMLGGFYLLEASGATAQGDVSPSPISVSGQDLRLAAAAAGPDNELVILAEVAPRLANGWDPTEQEILAERIAQAGSAAVSLGPLETLATAGANTNPAVAVDPETDVAVAAWQTAPFGIPSIQWSLSTPSA